MVGLSGGKLWASVGRNKHLNTGSSNTQYWLLLPSCAAICDILIKQQNRMRWLASWDFGFELRRGHGCLSLVQRCVLFLRLADPSSREVIPSVVCRTKCDSEASIMGRPWPTGGLLRHGNKKGIKVFKITDTC